MTAASQSSLFFEGNNGPWYSLSPGRNGNHAAKTNSRALRRVPGVLSSVCLIVYIKYCGVLSDPFFIAGLTLTSPEFKFIRDPSGSSTRRE